MNKLKTKYLEIYTKLNFTDFKIKELQFDKLFIEKELKDVQNKIEEKIGFKLDSF